MVLDRLCSCCLLSPGPGGGGSAAGGMAASSGAGPAGGGRHTHSNLYINNIPAEIDESSLKALFGPYGVIDSLRLVKNAKSAAGKSFAFIKYSNLREALDAIRAVHGLPIGNSTLEVKFADADAGERNPEYAPPPSDNVYVKNLPSSYTEADLRALFARFGGVVECRILHKGDGIHGAGALVRMCSIGEATNAISQLHNQRPPGGSAMLVVRYADSPEQKLKRQIKPGAGRPDRSSSLSPEDLIQSVANLNVLSAGCSADYSSSVAIIPQSSVLSSSMKGGRPEAPSALLNQPYMPMPNAPHGAPAALNRPDLSSLAPHRPEEMAASEIPLLYQEPCFSLDAPSSYLQYDQNLMDMLAQNIINTPSAVSSCSVYIKHLPPEADRLFLYEKFAPFGAILSVKIMLDEVDRCKGVAFVNFAHPEAAAHAAQAMNGIPVGDKRLHVSIQSQRSR